MAILSEICSFDSTKRAEIEHAKKDEVKELLEDVSAILRLSRSRDGERYKYLEEAIKAQKQLDSLRVLSKDMALPKGLECVGFRFYGGHGNAYMTADEAWIKKDKHHLYFTAIKTDALMKASVSPVTMMQNLQALAEAFCFCIMPVAALDTKIVKTGPRAAIDSFSQLRDHGLDVYAMAPLALYNMSQHAEQQDCGQMYGGLEIQQTIASVMLSVPLFSVMLGSVASLTKEVKELKNRVETLERTTKDISHQLKSMQQNISVIQDRVARQRILQLSDGAHPNSSLMADDPLLFALNKGTSLADPGATALLGPCWGADIHDALVKAAGYKPSPKLRKEYEAAMAKWSE